MGELTQAGKTEESSGEPAAEIDSTPGFLFQVFRVTVRAP